MATNDDEAFLSKISLNQDEHENMIESILNKDEDNISKSELDDNIATLIEKLQSLDVQESMIPEKAKNKAEQHGEERKIRYKRKTYKINLRIFASKEKSKKVRAYPLHQKRRLDLKEHSLTSMFPKESWIHLPWIQKRSPNIIDC